MSSLRSHQLAVRRETEFGASNLSRVFEPGADSPDTIDSWPMDTATATPLGVIQDSKGLYQLTGGARFGLYQILRTRDGGEIVGGSSY